MNEKFYEKFKWLENIGVEENINTRIQTQQILSIKDIEKSIKTDLWSNILLEGQNELSLLLIKNKNTRDNWNIYVDDSKKIYNKSVKKIIESQLKKNSISSTLKNDISYDFTLLYLLNSYKEKIDEYCFLQDILKVYEAGHLPCGWIGPVEEKGIPTIEESIREVYSSDIDDTYKKGILLYY